MSSKKPEHYEELARLISALLDGQLSETERERLETLLKSNPEARRLYLQMIDQEVELSCLVTPVAQSASEKVVPLVQPAASKPEPSPLARRVRWFAAAAVFTLMATVLAFVISRRQSGTDMASPKESVAPLQSTAVWTEDFEGGSVDGWLGRFIATNLPPGSRHAVAPAIERWPEGDVHTIRLPENWVNGLFALKENSTLHITYRFARGTHVNVFMHAMPANVNSPPSMYQLRAAAFPRRSEQWQTASIPFSQFVRKVRTLEGTLEFSGGPPTPGERVASLAFSSPDEIDFVIDRIWVTSGPNEKQANRNPNP